LGQIFFTPLRSGLVGANLFALFGDGGFHEGFWSWKFVPGFW